MPNFNLVDTLIANPAKFGEHRDQNKIYTPILENEDLSGKKLSKADLSKANLKNANLSNTDLAGANLNWADLTGANLAGTDLTGASFESAVFDWSQLSKAKGIPKVIILGDLRSGSSLVHALTGIYPNEQASNFYGVIRNALPFIFFYGVSHQERMDEMGKAENNFAQAILIMDLSESIYGEKRLEVIKAKQSGIKKVLVFIKNDFIKDEDLEELTQMEVETELKNNGLPSEGVTVTGSVNKEDGSTAINDLWEKMVA